MTRVTARNLFVPLGLVLGVSVCTPPPESTPTPAAVSNPEPVPAFEATVTRLAGDEASRIAREARAEVSLQLAPGIEASLWAPEQLIADPIGISIDSLGRVFATRTSRTDRAEIDIRGHRDWMVSSITFRDVEDKRAFYLRELAPERSAQNQWLTDYNGDGSRDWRDLTVHKERLYRIEDTNADGLADFSQLILEDFNDVVSDVAHGVLAYNDELYLTVSPDLWRLRDTNGDGKIDTKESLARGSGVHIGFGGHGLSGPVIGPDGRLYWKQGDLGINLRTRDGRHLYNPHQGVILRAEPDGTNAEIFAAGLRNPQEFAFDEYGNLITADNDGDHQGESERLVYVTDGSDSGWRINWQFGKYVDPDNNAYKVWMDEGLFKPRFEGQAAYIQPPIASYHAGPSGMVYNPGTALSEAWRNYYFVSVFTGTPATSRLQGFRLREKGAGFELADDKVVLSGIQMVGIDFSPDGALYVTDWIQGWEPKERGRIWKLDSTDPAAAPLRAETRGLIAASFEGRPLSEISGLLRHADMRVRTKAQFALVDRRAVDQLLAAARQKEHQLARVHALWGIGQLARKDSRQARLLTPLLADGDAEIRAQAARVLGDVRYAPAAGALVPLLADAAPRARFFAAEALGRIGHRPAVPGIVRMLEANDDQDAYLRHAGSLALARIGDADAVVALSTHASRAVRIAAVVALRRMRHEGVAKFLSDQDEYIVTEAARAINDDESIEGAPMRALAHVLDETSRFTSEALLRRAINANSRVGSPTAALRVATFAARPSVADPVRVEAISALGVWPRPSILDRVDGFPRGAAVRDTAAPRAAIASVMEPLFASGTPAVQVALAQAIGRLRMLDAAPVLLAKVRTGPTPEVRIAALGALQTLGDRRTEEAVRTALQDPETTVRMAALGAIPPLGLPEATTSELLSSVLARGTVAEQQTALSSLARLQGTTAREVLTRMVDQLAAGTLAPDIQLDVAEAARATKYAPLATRLDRLEQARAGAAPLVAYADALRGGDAREGQRVVIQHPAAQCSRCHGFGGRGPNVGPDLRGVGSRLTREQLLEALVHPSARIAPGFGAADAPSAMPPMGGILTRREIRDVVEFLTTLK